MIAFFLLTMILKCLIFSDFTLTVLFIVFQYYSNCFSEVKKGASYLYRDLSNISHSIVYDIEHVIFAKDAVQSLRHWSGFPFLEAGRQVHFVCSQAVLSSGLRVFMAYSAQGWRLFASNDVQKIRSFEDYFSLSSGFSGSQELGDTYTRLFL